MCTGMDELDRESLGMASSPIYIYPYPSYKPSGVPWLEHIPENWVVRRFGTVGRGFNNGTTVDQLDFSESAYLVSRIETISDGSVNYTRVGYLGAGPDYNTYLLKKDDFLISHINSYSRVGNSARYKGEKRLFHGMNLIRVTPLNSVVPVYLEYVLKSNVFIGAMQRACKPAINQVSVTTTAIKAIPLPLPPLQEQAAIVRYLDHVDRRIRRYVSAKQKLIALLEEEKQAIVNQAVTLGLDPNVRLKPSGVEWLGDVPEHWEIRRGKFFYREADERSTTGTEELMSVSHITGVTPRKKSVTMFLAESNMGYKLCRPGDIVINTMWAYMAALGVARQNGLVSPSYGVYRPLNTERLNHDYIDSLLRTEAYRTNYLIRSTGITSSRLRLYPESFLGIPLLGPPSIEQDAIVEYLERATAATNAAIARARQQIELLQEYRTRLIADVVTGKLDVREPAAHLPDEADEEEPIGESGPMADGLPGDLYDIDESVEDSVMEEEVTA